LESRVFIAEYAILSPLGENTAYILCGESYFFRKEKGETEKKRIQPAFFALHLVSIAEGLNRLDLRDRVPNLEVLSDVECLLIILKTSFLFPFYLAQKLKFCSLQLFAWGILEFPDDRTLWKTDFVGDTAREKEKNTYIVDYYAISKI
jgi:hypothetical protein